jgi:DinB superfamily
VALDRIGSVPTPAHLALTPEVDEFRRQFEQLANDADALVAPLSDAQFTWNPRPNAWSVAECIDHLNVTARMYLPVLDEGIANAIRQGQYGEGPYAYWWLPRMFVRMLEPPARFRTKTPAAFRPPSGRTRHEIMAAFRAYQVQYVDRLRQANGLDLARARARSPVVSWMVFPLGCGFAAMAAHERRHLWQARQVTDAPGFPQYFAEA